MALTHTSSTQSVKQVQRRIDSAHNNEPYRVIFIGDKLTPRENLLYKGTDNMQTHNTSMS